MQPPVFVIRFGDQQGGCEKSHLGDAWVALLHGDQAVLWQLLQWTEKVSETSDSDLE